AAATLSCATPGAPSKDAAGPVQRPAPVAAILNSNTDRFYLFSFYLFSFYLFSFYLFSFLA
ncbi:MAG: hypothetical protein KKD00_03595, partial [Gammaproteobacteria bacterium]|nr:hypothetical protein [Gammaproteobacteria bacterium]